MRSTFSDLATLAAVLALTACSFTPSPSHPRPILPAQPSIAPKPVVVPELTGFERTDSHRWRGSLRGAEETVAFELWSKRETNNLRPLVLLVPILAGGSMLMEFVADDMFDRGFDVAFCQRAGSAMKEGQRGPDLQELFRRTVLHQRLLLSWLRDSASKRPQFVLGISLGGMIATAVAAHEPGLAGLAICLSGGDLQSLVPASAEPRVQRWLHWRQRADGVGVDHVSWELGQELLLDPVATAAAVPTAKVLFVSADYDEVVPPANQNLLWEALGRPARLTVPLGHYSAVLAIGPILTAAANHFGELLPLAQDTPP